MARNKNKKIKTSMFVGMIVLVLGIILCLGSLIFNWVTSNDGNGANIGAGILFLGSLVVIFCGLITCFISALTKR